MLEPPETDMRHRCKQCSHEAVWLFQLDHHIQRSHKDVHTAGLFSIAAELERYPCVYCDFDTCYKLGRYEHCIRKHENNGDFQNDEEFEKTYSCNYCLYEGLSSLSLLKHSCKTFPNDLLADVGPSAISPIDFENDVKPQNLTLIGSSGGFDDEQLSYKNKDGSVIEPELTKCITASAAGIKWFCCPTCSHRYKLIANLKRHMLRHAKSDEINFSSCTQDGDLEKQIMWTDGKFKRFRCNLCSHQAQNKKGLKSHMVIHLPPEQIAWFNCPICSYRSKRKRGLKPHMLVHDTNKWLNCTECSFQTKRQQGLTNHMLMHTAPEHITWFNCPHCSYRSKRKHDLKSHVPLHSESNRLNCTECSFRATSEKRLKQHLLIHETNPLFSCAKCPYGSKRKGDLVTHMRIHAAAHEINWFSCTKCAYRSKIKGHLNRHMLTHAETKVFSCTECTYRTKRREDLIRHMRVHTKKLFSCAKCPYSSRRKGDLVIHMATHAAAREINWFSCTKCGYRTKRKGHFNRHMGTHGESKLFSCTKCPYQAKTKSEITRHLPIHAETCIDQVKWFNCTECSHRTKWKSSLKVHMVKHSRAHASVGDWFSCTECSYRSSRKRHVHGHMSKMHATATTT